MFGLYLSCGSTPALVAYKIAFPKAHEVFDGNVQDRSTVDQMLDILDKRTGRKAGGTVIVDRGMAYEENLEQIRRRGLHYLVAGRQPERNQSGAISDSLTGLPVCFSW